MVMRKKRIVLCICLVCLIFSMGCATLGIHKKTEREDDELFLETKDFLAVHPDLRFDDLPIPVGFLIDVKNSYAFQNEETRVALLRYIGKKATRTLVQFFVEQMPGYNWVLLNQIEFEKIVLNFEKAQETCIVIIEPQRTKTLVTISLAPK